jgi:hypothetical protein
LSEETHEVPAGEEPYTPPKREPPKGVGRYVKAVVPSKRVKNAWRKSRSPLSLREWALRRTRGAVHHDEIHLLIRKWLENKK